MKLSGSRVKARLIAVAAAVVLGLAAVVYHLADYAAGTGVLILAYHRVGDFDSEYAVPVGEFSAQMDYLQHKGYHSITLDQLAEAIETGAGLPPRAVVITFDDGYWDNLTNAYPIVAARGFVMTVFVVPEYIGRYYDFLTWPQVAELVATGRVTIGSHTMDHQPLAELAPGQQAAELVDSKRAIELATGLPCRHFAYPFGSFSQDTLSILAGAGYRTACTGITGLNWQKTSLLLLRRTNIVKSRWGMWDFRARIFYSEVKFAGEKLLSQIF
ncbi:MAG: polysaccharide deacetylase family protein [Negativicutes bacterium]|nr:polysaccharide deacetylase family protein [Negativicutes bacterium]